MSFIKTYRPIIAGHQKDDSIRRTAGKFSDYTKLLKTPNVLLPNVILNSNSKHPKTKPIIQTVENDMQLLTSLTRGMLKIT
jgi:hypothetical protein